MNITKVKQLVDLLTGSKKILEVTIDDKIYANLILHSEIWDSSTDKMISNPHSKPSESDCIAGLKAMQDAWDLENDSYKSKRRAEYPSIADQLDDIYHNGIDGWKATIKAVKDKYTK